MARNWFYFNAAATHDIADEEDEHLLKTLLEGKQPIARGEDPCDDM
tara:strand:+ start:604 stop:741 length:138 start_codon:yes stop_codon:yes gene_type:complete